VLRSEINPHRCGRSSGERQVGERFSDTLELDTVALSQRFYATHADLYDQLVVWADTRVAPRTAFAYEVTVANDVWGIGVDLFDRSRDFGSSGRLRSVVVMDRLTKYPDDPAAKFKGEDSTLSILGQETGHRWLAFVRFRDHNRATSDALLGRDLAHWSFFFDSGSWREMTSSRSAAASFGRSPPCSATAGSINI
jgi:hypothetical protein